MAVKKESKKAEKPVKKIVKKVATKTAKVKVEKKLHPVKSSEGGISQSEIISRGKKVEKVEKK